MRLIQAWFAIVFATGAFDSAFLRLNNRSGVLAASWTPSSDNYTPEIWLSLRESGEDAASTKRPCEIVGNGKAVPGRANACAP